ncbi:MAG: NADP-dependent malic enzyme [Alphaproteobacteria bacterium]|nr:NADP-dependent malic enzyme [Alphaproteobacteria bacterium]
MQTIVDEELAKPILIGREDVILSRIKKLGLRLKKNVHFDLVNPEMDPRYNDYWTTYHKIMQRKGVTPAIAKQMVRTRNSVIAALMVEKDEADALICGTIGRYDRHYKYITDVLGHAAGNETYASLAVMIINKGTFFLCDPFVNPNPTAEQLCDMTLMAAEEVRRFGLVPKVALLSHSDFGSVERPETIKMRQATQLIRERAPELEVEGEMTGSAALDEGIREMMFPNSELKGQANLLIMPNIDAANIVFHMMKTLSDGIAVGPLLLGTTKPAHILIPSVTSRGIVNAAAYASACADVVVEKQIARSRGLKKPVKAKPKAKPKSAAKRKRG